VGKVDWERQLGRRVKLQALHALCAVAECGSLSQAARYFGCSQPAISALIAELEETVGVRLLDRSAKGVEPNIYGHALLRRWAVAFDELKQGLNDIESLAGSPAGELRIGCTEGVANAILKPIIEAFAAKHPSVCLRVNYDATLTPELSQLRDRNIDVCLGRWRKLPVADGDFNVEVLLEDETVVAASKRSMPRPFLVTYSVPLRISMVANSEYITVFPASILRFNHDLGLVTLPVELPPQVWPIAIVTLRNRVMTPAAQLFCEEVRAFARTLVGRNDKVGRAVVS
jgi:DNA-binding transcriptional LysR family regulator